MTLTSLFKQNQRIFSLIEIAVIYTVCSKSISLLFRVMSKYLHLTLMMFGGDSIPGYIYLQLKQYELALQDYDRTIELNPLYGCSYNNRGIVYSHLKNLKQARADFTRAWALHPKHVYHGLNAEWSAMSEEQPDLAMAERLEEIAALLIQKNIVRMFVEELRCGFKKTMSKHL